MSEIREEIVYQFKSTDGKKRFAIAIGPRGGFEIFKSAKTKKGTWTKFGFHKAGGNTLYSACRILFKEDLGRDSYFNIDELLEAFDDSVKRIVEALEYAKRNKAIEALAKDINLWTRFAEKALRRKVKNPPTNS